MSDTAINEMISAFAAGCMDEKNHLYFKEYLEENGALPDKQLGELQNIMALLPLLLEKEELPPDLKKQVAKKLLSLQTEIKAKIQTEKRKTLNETGFKTPASQPKSEPVVLERAIPQPLNMNTTQISGEDLVSSSFPPSGLNLQEKLEKRKDMSFREQEFVLTRNHWFGIFALVTLLVAIVASIFLLYKALDSRVSTVTDKFDSISSEINLNTDFRENYFSLMQFFNNSDVLYYQLRNIDNTSDATAKIFLSFSGNSGLIQMKNMPALSSDQTYQLWIRTASRDYSGGTFIPNPGRQFQEIAELPPISAGEIEMIFITQELRPGSSGPQGNIFIQARVKKETPPAVN